MKKQILLTALLATAFGINAISIQQLIDEGQCRQVNSMTNHLYLGDEDIDDLTGLENIPGIDHVTELILSGNKITTIEGFFDNLPNIQSIDLEHNQIKSIDNCFRNCPKLRYIYIRYNSIDSLDINAITQIPSLTGLNLYNNCLNLTEEERGILQTRFPSWFTYGSQREPEIDLSGFKFAD